MFTSPNAFGGAGGAGTASSINGTSVGRAGGGGGAVYSFGPVLRNPGTGSSGGGPAGGNTAGTNTLAIKSGTANTGGGAGGNGANNAGTFVGNGGSGIVIIAYPDTFAALTSISGGLTYSQPSRSGYRVYQFTGGTGTVTI